MTASKMEITVTREVLTSALCLCRKVADRKATMPILANVLLRTDDDKLLVASTDLETSVLALIPAQVKSKGAVTLPAKVLDEIARALPGDEAKLTVQSGHRVDVRSARLSYDLAGLDARDFPRLPDTDHVRYETIEAALLRDLIEKVSYSVSTDETLPHIHGACMYAQDGVVVLASTDGHRLSEAKRQLDGELRVYPHIIVPRKGLAEIRAVLEGIDGAVEFSVHQGHLFVRVGMVTIAVRLAGHAFPDYQAVIPKEHTKRIVVDRAALRSVIKRVIIVTNGRENLYGVKLTLAHGLLVVESDNPDLGQGREELDIEYLGPPLTIGFNGRFLIQMLDVIESQQVQLELAGELDPLLCRPVQGGEGEGAHETGYTAVVMPMRV